MKEEPTPKHTITNKQGTKRNEYEKQMKNASKDSSFINRTIKTQEAFDSVENDIIERNIEAK